LSEKVVDSSKNGVLKETLVNSSTLTETGMVDEVSLVIEQGEAKEVSLTNIEKGLTALWQAAGKPRTGEAEPPVNRACVFNLVICVNGDEELNAVTQIIASITYSYPSRSIVLVRKPDEPTAPISAYISAHCQLPTSTGKKVCCEQITVVGKGDSVNGLWSLVLPLLVPDLPVMLWWPHEPVLDGPLFTRLVPTADRLIIDSRTFDRPSQSFARLAQLAQGEYRSTAFSDLGWARLSPWRSTLAQFFDDPKLRPFLLHISRVEIDYEAPQDNAQPNFSEGLLLVGWLAKQLGWQPAFNLRKKGPNAILILNQGGLPLTVIFNGHNDRTDDTGGITRIQLEADTADEEGSEDAHTATFSIEQDNESERAITKIVVDNNQPMINNVLFPQRDTIDLLCEDLNMVRRDQLFEDALALAGHFSQ
jgi:glucose-6-phosphate dehydrogenase assembly protein OpcA